jgi:hypothetical protein
MFMREPMCDARAPVSHLSLAVGRDELKAGSVLSKKSRGSDALIWGLSRSKFVTDAANDEYAAPHRSGRKLATGR